MCHRIRQKVSREQCNGGSNRFISVGAAPKNKANEAVSQNPDLLRANGLCEHLLRRSQDGDRNSRQSHECCKVADHCARQ